MDRESSLAPTLQVSAMDNRKSNCDGKNSSSSCWGNPPLHLLPTRLRDLLSCLLLLLPLTFHSSVLPSVAAHSSHLNTNKAKGNNSVLSDLRDFMTTLNLPSQWSPSSPSGMIRQFTQTRATPSESDMPADSSSQPSPKYPDDRYPVQSFFASDMQGVDLHRYSPLDLALVHATRTARVAFFSYTLQKLVYLILLHNVPEPQMLLSNFLTPDDINDSHTLPHITSKPLSYCSTDIHVYPQYHNLLHKLSSLLHKDITAHKSILSHKNVSNPSKHTHSTAARDPHTSKTPKPEAISIEQHVLQSRHRLLPPELSYNTPLTPESPTSSQPQIIPPLSMPHTVHVPARSDEGFSASVIQLPTSARVPLLVSHSLSSWSDRLYNSAEAPVYMQYRRSVTDNVAEELTDLDNRLLLPTPDLPPPTREPVDESRLLSAICLSKSILWNYGILPGMPYPLAALFDDRLHLLAQNKNSTPPQSPLTYEPFSIVDLDGYTKCSPLNQITQALWTYHLGPIYKDIAVATSNSINSLLRLSRPSLTGSSETRPVTTRALHKLLSRNSLIPFYGSVAYTLPQIAFTRNPSGPPRMSKRRAVGVFERDVAKTSSTDSPPLAQGAGGRAEVAEDTGGAVRVLFGSGNNQQRSNGMWQHMGARCPDLFVWTGDAVYGDRTRDALYSLFTAIQRLGASFFHSTTDTISPEHTEPRNLYSADTGLWPIETLHRVWVYVGWAAGWLWKFLGNVKCVVEGWFAYRQSLADKAESGGDVQDMLQAVNNLTSDPFYQSFLSSLAVHSAFSPAQPTVIGARGAHDFVRGEAGAAAYADFLKRSNMLASSTRGLISTGGEAGGRQVLYGTEKYVHGEGQSVAVIVLDTSSYATADDILGEEQWHWLKGVVANSTATVNLIVSNRQILPLYRSVFFETWESYPASRHRLLTLILSSNLSAPLILSSSSHISEVSRLNCHRRAYRRVDRPPTNQTNLQSSHPHDQQTLIPSNPTFPPAYSSELYRNLSPTHSRSTPQTPPTNTSLPLPLPSSLPSSSASRPSSVPEWLVRYVPAISEREHIESGQALSNYFRNLLESYDPYFDLVYKFIDLTSLARQADDTGPTQEASEYARSIEWGESTRQSVMTSTTENTMGEVMFFIIRYSELIHSHIANLLVTLKRLLYHVSLVGPATDPVMDSYLPLPAWPFIYILKGCRSVHYHYRKALVFYYTNSLRDMPGYLWSCLSHSMSSIYSTLLKMVPSSNSTDTRQPVPRNIHPESPVEPRLAEYYVPLVELSSAGLNEAVSRWPLRGLAFLARRVMTSILPNPSTLRDPQVGVMMHSDNGFGEVEVVWNPFYRMGCDLDELVQLWENSVGLGGGGGVEGNVDRARCDAVKGVDEAERVIRLRVLGEKVKRTYDQIVTQIGSDNVYDTGRWPVEFVEFNKIVTKLSNVHNIHDIMSVFELSPTSKYAASTPSIITVNHAGPQPPSSTPTVTSSFSSPPFAPFPFLKLLRSAPRALPPRSLQSRPKRFLPHTFVPLYIKLLTKQAETYQDKPKKNTNPPLHKELLPLSTPTSMPPTEFEFCDGLSSAQCQPHNDDVPKTLPPTKFSTPISTPSIPPSSPSVILQPHLLLPPPLLPTPEDTSPGIIESFQKDFLYRLGPSLSRMYNTKTALLSVASSSLLQEDSVLYGDYIADKGRMVQEREAVLRMGGLPYLSAEGKYGQSGAHAEEVKDAQAKDRAKTRPGGLIEGAGSMLNPVVGIMEMTTDLFKAVQSGAVRNGQHGQDTRGMNEQGVDEMRDRLAREARDFVYELRYASKLEDVQGWVVGRQYGADGGKEWSRVWNINELTPSHYKTLSDVYAQTEGGGGGSGTREEDRGHWMCEPMYGYSSMRSVYIDLFVLFGMGCLIPACVVLYVMYKLWHILAGINQGWRK
eukprot:GHVQ01021555.1.p1 GENE.GHVQ01021555.1~~GHVQ01021555.1.p1  ORF type:complete len:1906 (+),score=228.34 GHVQ01021555.1:1659-7376(+)